MCDKVEYWFDLISQRFQFLILVWLWCFDGIASNVMLNGLRKLRHTSHAHKMIIIDTLPLIISYTYIKLIVSLCLWPFAPLSILVQLVWSWFQFTPSESSSSGCAAQIIVVHVFVYMVANMVVYTIHGCRVPLIVALPLILTSLRIISS